jgi:N-methylhydantoinase A/oxoprolinase/acetone carboxylase beta subunit
MQKYIIGIDTGGTFTDAVLLDCATRKIIATAKKPTTHYQLASGTGNALGQLLQDSGVNPEAIEMICVSSTLATNSVVENKGARVAIIVIGYVRHFKLPVKAVLYVKGGHDIQGKEEEPLELDYLVSLVEGLKKEVDAYGICSAMSMVNPTHELVAEKAIEMIDPKPVFCSHRISNLTGMQERAATAGLHAKLMPIMQDFISGVEQSLAANNLHCPLVMIGGNGKPLVAGRAITEAGLTVASGPACTAHFGAIQTNTQALVVDVGGTTTDIAMIENGVPQLAQEGCRIGQWQTHVEAIDMFTGGIGGDSHVHITENLQLSIGPARVTPLAMAGAETRPVRDWLGIGDNSRQIIIYPEKATSMEENEVSQLLRAKRLLTPATIRKDTGLGGIPLDTQLEEMTRHNQIYECGFTPTDALHVLGEIELGDRESAIAGATILGNALGMGPEEFAKLVLRRTEEQIETLILDYIIQRYWHNSLANFIATHKDNPALGVEFSLKIPLIGIGAAARYLLPGVAARLKTKVSFPENCEVGNAIGAALIGLTSEQTIAPTN